MSRPPVGTKAQDSSDTALAAHLASRLCGVQSDRTARDAWLKDRLDLKLRSNGLARAAPRARASTTAWTLIDESTLPLTLEKAMVIFPGDGRRRPVLAEALASVGAVRQLVETRSRRDIICVLLYLPNDRDEFFGVLEALGERFLWEEIIEEDRALEADAWLDLARRLARAELLGESA
jgi:hypothetical protein